MWFLVGFLMAAPRLRATRLAHLLLDHALIWFLIQFLDFGPVNVVAKLCPLLCGLGSLAGFMGHSTRIQTLLYSLMTILLLLCTPGTQSEFVHFLIIWGTVCSLSWISRKWGLLKLKEMLGTQRHAVDLAFARIVVSLLTLFVVLFGKYDHAMIPHNGSHYLALRDVSKCGVTEQTGLQTGIPIAGLSEWSRISLKTIHYEEIMLLLASLFSFLGVFKRWSMMIMFFLQLRVFGQQFFFGQYFFPVEDADLVHIERGIVHLHHTLTLLLWSSLLLVFSPSTDMLSIDAILAATSRNSIYQSVNSTTKKGTYGLPINVSILLLGIGYLASGLSKAGSGLVFGSNWINCFVLEGIVERHFVGYSELVSRGLTARNRLYLYAEWRFLRVLLSKYPVIFRFGALATVVWECAFMFLVSHGGYCRLFALLIGVGFHTSIYLLTGINFGVHLCTYFIFFPWGRVLDHMRSLKRPVEILHNDSSVHLQMKRILESWSLLGNLKFVHEDQAKVEEGNYTNNLAKKQVVLPNTPSSVYGSNLLYVLSNWICTSKVAGSHFFHIVPLLSILCWGSRCWESLMGVWKRVGKVSWPNNNRSAKQPQISVGTLLVALISLISVAWTSFAGEANAWPFASLPKFTAIEFPQEQVLFPDHNFTVSGSWIGYGVTSEGERRLIDAKLLLRTEPDYEVMREAFEWEIGSWPIDNLKLPLQCVDHRFRSLPPWFLWLVSQGSEPSGREVDSIGVEWKNSFMSAISRCRKKNAPFLTDPDVNLTCNILRSSYKIQYYRRELNVPSGPPWQEGEWTVGKLAYESILSH